MFKGDPITMDHPAKKGYKKFIIQRQHERNHFQISEYAHVENQLLKL